MKMYVRKEKTLQKQRGEGEMWIFPGSWSLLISRSVCAGVALPGRLCAPWIPALEQVCALKDLLPVQGTLAGAGLS